MKGKAKKAKKEKYSKVEKADGVDAVAGMDGVVVPTNVAPTSDAPPPETAPETAPADPVTGSRLPPLTGSAAASRAAYSKRAEWNPNGLDVSFLPGPLQAQFVPEYLKTAPSYLDGSTPGDIGFDPWGLVALAAPTQATRTHTRQGTCRERGRK